MQPPKGYARGQDRPTVGRGKDDICKDQQAKAAAKGQQEMARLTEGLGLPPDFKLPF